MKISIVVPAFNEAKLIGRSLQSIRDAARVFGRLGWTHELIVCDNNSTDRTAALARESGACVVFEPINQIARARNTGAAAATGDWLIFVDADSYPSAELFQDVADHLRQDQCLGGGATVALDEPLGWAGALTQLWNLTSRSRRWMAGSFIFCETATFRELGGFSQKLFVAEEIEFSQRLNQLASKRKKRVAILHEHPLKTSARKVHLYSLREHLVFLVSSVWQRGRTFKSRDACSPWYDGRR